MSLSALIRKREKVEFATATLATVATLQGKTDELQPTVASVATVAVANPQTVQAANDPDKAVHYAWLIHFKDRDPATVTFSPMATHAEALANYPDAVAAEPVGKSSMRRILNAGEEAELRALIEVVYRDDSPEDQNEALQSALIDPDNAQVCYTAIASERGLIVTDSDDRRFCRECSNLRGPVCTIAQPGGAVSAKKGYTPSLELPHRCGSFIERNAK